MSTSTYRVEGMSCSHCVQAVTREVSALSGVAAAVVDLNAGTVAVTGEVTEAEVASAVADAGYTLAGRVL